MEVEVEVLMVVVSVSVSVVIVVFSVVWYWGLIASRDRYAGWLPIFRRDGWRLLRRAAH